MPLLFTQSSPFLLPSLPVSRSLTPPFPQTLTPIHRRRSRRCRRRFSPLALHISDHDLLQALTRSPAGGGGDASAAHLPAVRSYENDLACLTLVGSVGFEQALVAAAADGGDAADEHLAAGTSTMVVETVFPGSGDEHSTVSTRLFLPARKVKEKAKKLRSSLTADILSSSSTVSKNILAMTFRQVVMLQFWSFKLSFFFPDTERDMKDLANPREVPANYTVSSLDERFLSTLAEVVCSCALESTKRVCLQNVGGLSSNIKFDWFQKTQKISSIDSSICIYKISGDQMAKDARNQIEKFNSVKEEFVNRKKKLKHRWWDPPNFSRLDRVGGSGFGAWVNEFIPAYRLQIDGNKFKDTKLEGCQELDDNRWEVLLTHSQMVGLGSILDMYYEDQYTLPDKELSCALVTESPVISRNKDSSWKLLFATLAGGCALVFVSILAQLCWPNLLKASKAPNHTSILSASESYCSYHKSPGTAELEALCISVVKRIKDELDWPGDIMVDADIGVWIGALPNYLREPYFVNAIPKSEKSIANSSTGDSEGHAASSTCESAIAGADSLAKQTTIQDIASYQVVMSGDGKIIGFQPTSRVAVNHWASNPLVKDLYGRQKLEPGLLEPSLKIACPSEVVLIELLMSVNPESRFALARSLQ